MVAQILELAAKLPGLTDQEMGADLATRPEEALPLSLLLA
jgi:hypothetical protein